MINHIKYYWYCIIGLRPYHIVNRFKWFWQRRKRGFDDRELWALDYTIAKFVLPRLMRFKNIKHGCPGSLVNEFGMDLGTIKWNKMLDKMIFAFTFVIDREQNCSRLDWHKEYPKYKEGMKLFAEHFKQLWD